MTDNNDLLSRLCPTGPFGTIPLTPEKASALIVSELLGDLPDSRREAVRRAIEEWSGCWGDLVGATAYESGER
jgi:hypothetical protein